MQSTSLNSPWLFFSIITEQRSVDLYMEETKLINWFYGIKKYLMENSMNYKIISVNNFILTRMKLRLINKLRELKDVKQYKDIINNILQGMISYIIQIDKTVQSFSFVKILLLYLKIKK
jgi:predicted secreted protein